MSAGLVPNTPRGGSPAGPPDGSASSPPWDSGTPVLVMSVEPPVSAAWGSRAHPLRPAPSMPRRDRETGSPAAGPVRSAKECRYVLARMRLVVDLDARG